MKASLDGVDCVAEDGPCIDGEQFERSKAAACLVCCFNLKSGSLVGRGWSGFVCRPVAATYAA